MPANRLIDATLEDNRAKLNAWELGVNSTKPMSADLLARMCTLGENMMHTALRKKDAERDVSDQTIGVPRRLLPA